MRTRRKEEKRGEKRRKEEKRGEKRKRKERKEKERKRKKKKKKKKKKKMNKKNTIQTKIKENTHLSIIIRRIQTIQTTTPNTIHPMSKTITIKLQTRRILTLTLLHRPLSCHLLSHFHPHHLNHVRQSRMKGHSSSSSSSSWLREWMNGPKPMKARHSCSFFVCCYLRFEKLKLLLKLSPFWCCCPPNKQQPNKIPNKKFENKRSPVFKKNKDTPQTNQKKTKHEQMLPTPDRANIKKYQKTSNFFHLLPLAWEKGGKTEHFSPFLMLQGAFINLSREAEFSEVASKYSFKGKDLNILYLVNIENSLGGK